MIVSVLQENLAKSLNIVAKAVDSNPPLPVLANVLLETEDSRLKISATNLEMSITMWIGAKVEQSGSITLPAKTFGELVSSLSRERVDLRLDASTHTVHLRCGVQTSNIRGIDADEYPPINHNESADLHLAGRDLARDDLADRFRRRARAESPDLDRRLLVVGRAEDDHGFGRWLPPGGAHSRDHREFQRKTRYGRSGAGNERDRPHHRRRPRSRHRLANAA